MRESLRTRDLLEELTLPAPDLSHDQMRVLSVHAAVQMGARGRCGLAECRQALRSGFGQLSHSPLQALIRIQQSLAALDKTPLIPFVASLVEVLPEELIERSKDTEGEITRLFMSEEIAMANRGALAAYAAPWPDVEAWSGTAIAAIVGALMETLPAKSGRGAPLADLCVCAALLLSHALDPIDACFEPAQTSGLRENRFGMIARAFWEIETSVHTGVARELLCALSSREQHAFIQRCREIAGSRLRLWQAEQSESFVAHDLKRFDTVRGVFRGAAERACEYRKLSRMPEALAMSGLALPEAASPAATGRHMPIGEVVIVLAHTQRPALIAYDGRYGLVRAGISTGNRDDAFPYDFTIPGEAKKCSGAFVSLLGACLTQDGKLCSGPGDRHAPAPLHEEWYGPALDAVRRIDAAAYPILQQEWALHPYLFSTLKDAPPVLIVAFDDGRFIVAEKGFLPIQDLEEADLRGLELLRTQLYPRGSEVRRLDELGAAPTAPNELASTEEQSAWERIFHTLPGGKLSFEWLVQRLEVFDVRVVQEAGKGSHYKLVRSTAEAEYSYPVSKRFRRELNAANLLRRVLSGLGLNLEEFAERLA